MKKYKLTEKKGFVAAWIDVWFEEENDFFAWFDHDYAEGGSITPSESIQNELSSCSYGKSFAKKAAEAAEKLGVKSAEYVWLMFDYECSQTPGFLTDEEVNLKGVEALEHPIFLGNFEYTK